MLRLLAVLSVAIGIAAGAVVAVAVPRHTKALTIPKLAVRRTAAALPARPGQLDVRLASRPRILLTAPDPAGGPDWAIRSYSGSYAFPADVSRRHIGRELLGTMDCLEVGRLHDGAFGWLDGAGTFRPAPAGRQSVPRLCAAHGAPRDPGLSAAPLTWVSHPAFGEPQALATLLWGVVPPHTRSVRIRSGGATADLHRAADGQAFLAFLPPDGYEPKDTNVIAVDEQGHQQRMLRQFTGGTGRGPGRLAARAPDPDGGAPWGVAAARNAAGQSCTTNPGRVVGRGVGMLDTQLDIFNDQSNYTYVCTTTTGASGRHAQRLTHQRPLAYVSSVGVAETDVGTDAARDHGRVALRTDPGATVFAGQARADVVSITVVTPAQTRTIRPAGPAHAFVIAFAGSFPSGRIRLVSHFADGTTSTQDDSTGDL